VAGEETHDAHGEDPGSQQAAPTDLRIATFGVLALDEPLRRQGRTAVVRADGGGVVKDQDPEERDYDPDHEDQALDRPRESHGGGS
jgi:hypothetical protein